MGNILEQINNSADVKRIPEAQLKDLCQALREEILRTTAKNGGHLASNLGIVELTVALHRVYDTTMDRVLFDVGHQCYAHKLLTGRRDRFATLRQYGGLAGFPKPAEAMDDPCVSGHASTSISLALGMARARTLRGEHYAVAAVIGDGALTGGTAYEGLSDCGSSGEAIVIILNDNEMAINETVGGIARLLEKVRLRPGYLAFKRFYRRTVGRSETIYGFLHRIKEWLKALLLPDNLFTDLGFYYLGPVDGHDLPALVRTLAYAKELNEPVLIHVRTRKGKGYPPAEEAPAVYHGVGPFDPATGVRDVPTDSFSHVFGQSMCAFAARLPELVAVTAAMADGTGLTEFAQTYPSRFFDVGIAEEHAVSLCAGLALQGMKPVFAVYSSFLQRAYDMLQQDLGLGGAHVTLAVDRAGLVGADGETHQGAFDVGYLCAVPGLMVWAPSNYREMRSMLTLAIAGDGPAAVRYARGGEGAFRDDTAPAAAVVLRPGNDITIVTYGIFVNEALSAAGLLAQQGIDAEVVKVNRLDVPASGVVLSSVRKTEALVAVEDTARAGSVGERLLAEIALRGRTPRRAALLNLGRGVVSHGPVEELWRRLGLDAQGIAKSVEELLRP